MKNRCLSSAVACVGAVVGAGFASGREIVAFFTRYGQHAWWLIGLSAATMMLLCSLCMHAASRCGAECWCALFDSEERWLRKGAQLCTMFLMTLTGGAMLSAAGHMATLIFTGDWAYSIGAAATLIAAWLVGFASLRPLSWLSGVLTAVFLMVIVLLLKQPAADMVAVTIPSTGRELAWAALRAVGYASMNLTLAIGVVCRCTQCSPTANRRLVWCFGAMMAALLCMSNHLYSLHPELTGEAFPIVRLLGAFGRRGFLTGVLLLYLSIFTTLASVLYALRSAVENWFGNPAVCTAIGLGLPLAVSCIGFSGIVDGLYAPAGLLCLVIVFLPLVRRYLT